MKCPSHLSLETVELAPAAEWTVSFPGWCFLGLSAGQGYWLGEKGAQELNAGDVLGLSPLREGFFRVSQLGPVTLHYFRFDSELLTGLLTPAERDYFGKLAAQSTYAAFFRAADSAGAKLFALLWTMTRTTSALLQRCDMLRIVATLFARELSQPAPSETTVLTARQRLKLLMNQIPESEFLRLSPDEMALRCACSITYFNRSFSKLFGMSLRRKQETLRLLRARQRLVETTCRIEHVAEEVGYRTMTEFNAAFRRQFGVSPGEWRHPKCKKTAPRFGAADGHHKEDNGTGPTS
jgi:AraC-like DNA-binding protein